jgi:short-subunit dehydrogenase
LHTNIVTHQHLFNLLYPPLTKRPINPITQKRGAVLFTSSGLTFINPPSMSIYVATKAYMGAFGENLAAEAKGIY